MDIVKLFNMQKELDARIIKQHGLEGQDLLPQKILALQVELGECANEWRGFKYWSKDQKPRTEFVQPCFECDGKDIGMECFRCDGEGYEYKTNPLLEEYIDCLHFILSIGIELEPDMSDIKQLQSIINNEECGKFEITYVFTGLIQLRWVDVREYGYGFRRFITLGRLLGFTWEQIEEAYMSKNETNHKRQDTGY